MLDDTTSSYALPEHFAPALAAILTEKTGEQWESVQAFTHGAHVSNPATGERVFVRRDGQSAKMTGSYPDGAHKIYTGDINLTHRASASLDIDGGPRRLALAYLRMREAYRASLAEVTKLLADHAAHDLLGVTTANRIAEVAGDTVHRQRGSSGTTVYVRGENGGRLEISGDRVRFEAFSVSADLAERIITLLREG